MVNHQHRSYQEHLQDGQLRVVGELHVPDPVTHGVIGVVEGVEVITWGFFVHVLPVVPDRISDYCLYCLQDIDDSEHEEFLMVEPTDFWLEEMLLEVGVA